MPAVLIRPAQQSDCAAINAIYNFYVRTSPATFDTVEVTTETRQHWFEVHAVAGMPVLVADVDGDVAGWCSLSQWSPKAAYETTVEESIYIADRHRGHGLGRLLLTTVIDAARERETHVVMAGVVACQEPSLALHRSLEFEQTGLNPHMGFKLGQWHDVAYLQRALWR
ncbi:MAG: GNAT family N-acetyltransferase [Tepidiformaceae bacterium]